MGSFKQTPPGGSRRSPPPAWDGAALARVAWRRWPIGARACLAGSAGLSARTVEKHMAGAEPKASALLAYLGSEIGNELMAELTRR